MRLIFIRHAKTERSPDVPILLWGLSQEGIERANRLATHEVVRGIEVLYTSFQTKALETSVLLAKPNMIPICPDNGLTEVTSFTAVFEPNHDRYVQSVHDFYHDQIERLYGGETKTEALNRFNQTLQHIVTNEQGRSTIGIVAHGHILTLFSAQYRQVDSYSLHEQIRQPDIAIFDWEEKKFVTFFGELV